MIIFLLPKNPLAKLDRFVDKPFIYEPILAGGQSHYFIAPVFFEKIIESIIIALG